MAIIPSASNCSVASCPVDLGPGCPSQLIGPRDSSGTPVGCMSACEANLDNPSACISSHLPPSLDPFPFFFFFFFFYLTSPHSIPNKSSISKSNVIFCCAYAADSANCCTGSHNTATTCPASGVQFYSYFSTYRSSSSTAPSFPPFSASVSESNRKHICTRREQLPELVCLRV